MEPRSLVLVLIFASFVLSSAAMLALRRKIPVRVLAAWLLPLLSLTVILGFGIERMGRSLDANHRLFFSMMFGSIWIAVGGWLSIRARRPAPAGAVEAARKLSRAFGIVFVLFGVLWIAASCLQYLGLLRLS